LPGLLTAVFGYQPELKCVFIAPVVSKLPGMLDALAEELGEVGLRDRLTIRPSVADFRDDLVRIVVASQDQ
jgi:hypothetical protein